MYLRLSRNLFSFAAVAVFACSALAEPSPSVTSTEVFERTVAVRPFNLEPLALDMDAETSREIGIKLRSDLGEPLTVVNVEPQCGCMVAEASTGSWEPGSEYAFQLKIEAGRIARKERKTVKIHFKEIPTAPLVVPIDISVAAPIRLETELMQIPPGKNRLNLTAVIQNPDIEINSIVSMRGCVSVSSYAIDGDKVEIVLDKKFSIGRCIDVLRVGYTLSGEEKRVDIQLGIEANELVKFLPHTPSLSLENRELKFRLLVIRGNVPPLSGKEFSLISADGEVLPVEVSAAHRAKRLIEVTMNVKDDIALGKGMEIVLDYPVDSTKYRCSVLPQK